MGTLVHVAASGSRHEAELAIEAAFAAVGEVERLMSFHDPQSELSRINRDAARSPVTVHAWTLAVLRRAMRVSAASAGLFDIATAPLLVGAGLLPGSPEVLHRQGDWRHIVLLPNRQVFLSRPMQIDLGGIAKGFAVDCAIHELKRRGCTAGAVNAGGDMRRFGPMAYPVHLRREDGLVAVAELRCGAIATSEPRMKHTGRLAQPIGCIFDPRTQRPWESGGAVMVAAPSCVIADALTKVAALAGPDCSPLLSRFGARAMWGG
jgi:thiamine biosynthesis lipoprotein